MSPDPAATTTITTEQFGKLTTIVIAVTLFLWGILYRLLRPFVDQSRLDSWIRKGAEVEKILRDSMFKHDIDEQRKARRLAVRALRATAENAEAIGRMIDAQRVQSSLIGTLPHLAASMENMASNLQTLHENLAQTNEIARENGKLLAAHGALLGVESPPASPGRRQFVRRATDRPLVDEPHPTGEKP